MGFVITVVPFLLFAVRRSTRGKRGATKSAEEEEEEPEMSAECEPAAAASISESPPAALESMDLNVNPEPQTIETVPDSLSLELSSGSEEDRPRAKDDDDSVKSESDIVGTPVPNKKSTIKGIQSHRQLIYFSWGFLYRCMFSLIPFLHFNLQKSPSNVGRLSRYRNPRLKRPALYPL